MWKESRIVVVIYAILGIWDDSPTTCMRTSYSVRVMTAMVIFFEEWCNKD